MSAAETVMLASYRGSLNGPALELGPGTGRLTRVLVSLLADVTAADVSPSTVEATRRNVPEARAEVGDLRDLSRFADRSFRAIVASNNVLDILGDEARRRALRELARLLEDDVLLPQPRQRLLPGHVPRRLRARRAALPRDFLSTLYRSRTILRRVRNRRTARRFERADAEYALVNESVHDHSLVHSFISRDAQERQLAEAGLRLMDCFDIDGRLVEPGQSAERSTELHYAARRRTSAAN